MDDEYRLGWEIASEQILIDLVTLFLTVATVWIVWYVVKAVFPDDVPHLPFFLTFVVVIIPFIIRITFGSAIIVNDAITAPPWPTALPLVPSRPWLWLRWRKLRIRQRAATMHGN